MSQAVIDVGKSGIRGAVTYHAGTVTVEHPTGISPVGEGDQGALLATKILSMLERAEAPVDLETIVIGSTAELTSREAETLAATLGVRFPRASVALGDDGLLAHGLLLDGPGILLAVGTGVIAVARDGAERLSRADGWGPLLGDRGGAVDVGRNGLRSALRHRDGGRPSALHDRALVRFGAVDAALARRFTADRDWPANVAAFAIDVVELAADGDTDAGAIIDEAVTELVRTAWDIGSRTGLRRTAVTGRFARLQPLAARVEAGLRDADLDPIASDVPLGSLDASRFIAGPYRAGLRVWEPE